MTKVEAVRAFLKKRTKGTKQATWQQIYDGIEEFYPDATTSQFWQEGIRGIVYREIRYNRHFKFIPGQRGLIALR